VSQFFCGRSNLSQLSDESRLAQSDFSRRLFARLPSCRWPPYQWPKADIRIGHRAEIARDHCIAAAIFSADIRTGKLVLAHGTTGKIEASTTRRPWTPLTRPWLSTTAMGSSARARTHSAAQAAYTPWHSR